MKHIVHVVTGAPGAGKSTALEAFLRLGSGYLAFDIDWLAGAASGLAGRDIFSDESTWRPYSALWFEVLGTALKNGRTPVFFAPNDEADFEKYGLPAWCAGIRWLLLDCDDETRGRHLGQRPGWTGAMVAEAIRDAASLWRISGTRLDTGLHPPEVVALGILDWLDNSGRIGAGEREPIAHQS